MATETMAEVRRVIFGGRWWTLRELAGYARVDRRTLQSRLDRGMTVDDAIAKLTRRYPRGVHRSREERRVPSPSKARSSCERCGVATSLQRYADEWRLCTECAMLASIRVKQFVLRQS